MPAGKTNYIIIYENDSQVYGSSSKEVALSTPPPSHSTIEQKRVLFIAFHPDEGSLVVYELPKEEIMNTELKYHKKKTKDNDQKE